MMHAVDRSRFGFGELVTADTTKPGTNDDKLNLALDRIEASANERQLDHHPPGILTGLEVVENSVPNMTVKVNAGTADDQLGQRIEVPSQQAIDPLTDYQGNAIALPAGGQEKYVSVFLRFKRLEQNPTQDENSQPYYQDELEHFEIRVRAGSAAPTGTATKPALQGSEILLADIKLTPGMVAIGTGDIELLGRRQDAYHLTPSNNSPRTIRRGKIKDVVTDLLLAVNDLASGVLFVSSSGVSHTNGAEQFAGSNAPPTSGDLQTWLRALVTMLGKTTSTPGLALIGNVALGNWADGNSAGAAGGASTQLVGIVSALAAAAGLAKLGGAAKSGTPDSLSAGTGQNIVEQLLTLVNARARKANDETISGGYSFTKSGTGISTGSGTTADFNGPVTLDNTVTATAKVTIDLPSAGVGLETAADTKADFNGEVEMPRLNVGAQAVGVIAANTQIADDVGLVIVQCPVNNNDNYNIAMPAPAAGYPILHLKFYGGTGTSRRVWITNTAGLGTSPPDNYYGYWEASVNARAGAIFAWDGSRWRHIVSTGITGTAGGGTLAE